MRIGLRPWFITVIAMISIGGIFPLSHWASVVIHEPGSISNPIILWRIFLNILALIGGIALLFRMPWSRFCYLVIALMVSCQFIFWFPFATLFAGAMSHRVLPLTWEIVPFLISWAVVVVVFRHFKMTGNLHVELVTLGQPLHGSQWTVAQAIARIKTVYLHIKSNSVERWVGQCYNRSINNKASC